MFKIPHRYTYSTITNYHIKDKNLSLAAKGLMTWFLCEVTGWDNTLDDILRFHSNLSKEELINILNELVTNGYIVVDDTNNYKINEKAKKNANSNTDVEEDTQVSEQVANNPRNSKNLFTKCASYINDYTEDENLRKVLFEYLKLRLNPGAGTRLQKMPLQYFNQWRNLLISLDTMSGDKSKIVSQSISKQWAKFVPVASVTRDDIKSNSYTEEDIQKFKEKAKEIEEEGGKGIF